MSSPARVGLKLTQDCAIDDLRTVWRIADDAGFDHLWCFDHFASIGQGGAGRPVFEAWALQAAMAVATKRVRIGCNVTGNTYRPPWLLAKLAVTVDHLSGGRLEFGIGAAWNEDEHRMYAIPGLEHRVGMLSESLRLMKLLWTQDRVTFEGRYYTLRDAVAEPKPVQHPHPPIWIGVGGDQLLRLAARHADVWHVAGAAGAAPEAAAAKLEAECARIGRDPRAIRRSAQFVWDGRDRSAILETAARWRERGFPELIVLLSGDGPVRLADQVAEMLPELRAA